MALVNSSFAVNVTPGAMPPTVHVSEYDIGRTYTVTINGQNGSAFNIPAGTTATVEGTLNGAIGFTTNATISGSTVSFTLTESMTAKSGKAWCKIKLTQNDKPVSTCAFVLAVDRAGVEADMVIGADGFDTQIQNAVDNYLDEHPVGVEVDPTLTISGAAADAKVTGDEIGELKSDFSVMVSKNKINMATITKNAAINNNSTSPNYGKLYTENGYSTTGFIPVSKGDYIRLYHSAVTSPIEGQTLFAINDMAFRIAEYDIDRNIIYCSTNWVRFPYTVQTDGAAFVRVSAGNAASWMLFVNEESSEQPYYTAYKPKRAAITDLEKVFNPAEVITPSALYGVTGQQINVYKENIVAGNRLKSLAYIHTKMPDNAIQSDERTIWNPAGTALLESTKTWEVFKYGLENQPEIKPIKICNVPKSTGNASIKVLVIGDSKIAGGFVTYHFLHSFDDDDMSCTLLGTQYSWTSDNRHEGYGSRTAQWMCTNASSPFCNNGAFDFANYLTANSIDTPDYVFINLGTNDASQLSSGYAENFVTYITQMVNGIHAVSSSIKVIVGLCEGVCTTQDMNNAGFLNWDINRKISILHKASIAAFDNRASENIYVCPMYMGMDLTQDYRMNEVPLSQRDADINNGEGNGKTRMQVIDTVHQSEVGYWKNADYMYALVKYITAKTLT